VTKSLNASPILIIIKTILPQTIVTDTHALGVAEEIKPIFPSLQQSVGKTTVYGQIS
jgi:hypothetical protein